MALVVAEIEAYRHLFDFGPTDNDEQYVLLISQSGHVIFAPVVGRTMKRLVQSSASQTLTERREMHAIAALIEAMLASESFTLIDLASTGILEGFAFFSERDSTVLRDVLGDRSRADLGL